MDIAVQFEDWTQALSDIDMIARQAIAQILAELKAPQLGELSIALVSDLDIQILNRDFRQKDKPTNVLSFPDAGPAPLLGDIVLGLETITREATEKSISVEHHVTHLMVHGTLHLLGFDHTRDADAVLMEGLEVEILGKLDIPNPYS